MAYNKKSVLDKAEGLGRRMLERLGARVDARIGSDGQQTLNAREVSEIISQLERAVEENLRPDDRKIKRLAPDMFKVLLTYERGSELSPKHIAALAREFRDSLYEYINNRRYETRGPLTVDVTADLFAKGLAVKAGFSADRTDQAASSSNDEAAPSQPVAAQNVAGRTLSLLSSDGKDYRLVLNSEGSAAYIGRTAGTGVRIDDSSVSRLHASIALRPNGDIVISDVGSSNGTYVNERLLQSGELCVLQKGDVIGVGDFNISVSEMA